MPNNDSIIRIAGYDSPKQLADQLRLINNNDKMYNKFLEHKIDQKIQNEELLKQLKQRKYDTNSIVEDFECLVCQRSVDGVSTGDSETQKPEDMCSDEPIYPKVQTKLVNPKANLIKQGKCEASLLREMILSNQPFTQKQLYAALIERYNTGVCKF